MPLVGSPRNNVHLTIYLSHFVNNAYFHFIIVHAKSTFCRCLISRYANQRHLLCTLYAFLGGQAIDDDHSILSRKMVVWCQLLCAVRFRTASRRSKWEISHAQCYSTTHSIIHTVPHNHLWYTGTVPDFYGGVGFEKILRFAIDKDPLVTTSLLLG